MAKHINLLAGPFWWGALGPGLLPPLNPALENTSKQRCQLTHM